MDDDALRKKQGAAHGSSGGFWSGRDLSGTTLGGYQLLRKIGAGGMGVVYEAIQLKLDRKVALKVLNDQLGSRPEFLARFEREARAAAAINHPNVIHVHDFGEADGRHYLIMEYVDGQDLSEYVDKKGKLSVDEGLEIIEAAAKALKAAHEKSIVHRDIKPTNLMMTRDGRLKVSDLGLAKVLTETADPSAPLGIASPVFSAPEQLQNPTEADHRGDIYSLGVTLLYLLTGRIPHDGIGMLEMMGHTDRPLPSGLELGTDLPDEVEELIERMTAKDAAYRYPDYDLLLSDLQDVKAGRAPSAKLPEPASWDSQRFSWIAVGVCVLIVGIIGWIGFSLTKNLRTRENDPLAARQAADDAADPYGPRPESEPDTRPRAMSRDAGEKVIGAAELRLPMPPLPSAEVKPIAEGSVSEMLAVADQYAETNATNFRGIIDRYRQVRLKAAGTAQAEEIDQRISDWVSRHQRASREAIRTYETKMHEQLRAKKLHEAYAVWKDFPANLRTREVDEEIRLILQQALPAGFVPR